jgi:hypothetical protein
MRSSIFAMLFQQTSARALALPVKRTQNELDILFHHALARFLAIRHRPWHGTDRSLAGMNQRALPLA